MRTPLPETGWIPVDVGGLTLAVFDEGEGPPVLLQHGYPDTPHTFDDVAAALLDAGYRVVRPFGRGIAPSEASPDGEYGLVAQAADLIRVMGELQLEDVVLVGHDWGAAAAWGAAQMAPDLLKKLVAVAIPHPATLRPTLARAWQSRHFLMNRLPGAPTRYARNDFAHVRHMYERWSPDFEWPESEFEAVKNAYAVPGCLHAALGYYRQFNGWPFRGRVSCDTVIIGGTSDGVLDEAAFHASTRRVTGSCEVVMLPGGHFLHREHPQPFIDTLLSVLADKLP